MGKKTILFVSVVSISMLIGLIGIFFVPSSHSSYLDIAHSIDSGVRFYHDIDKPTILSDVNNRITVRLGARATESPEAEERVPLNLAIVLDKSGSMGGQNKIENAKQGAIEMISRLNERDIVSVVTFDSRPHVLVPAQRVRNKNSLIRKIRKIRADGSTALYSGIKVGAKQLRRYASSDYLSRIVLLSDGMANVGPQTNSEIFQLGESILGDDIHVSAIGLGLDFNEQLLTGLTANSGGNYYYTNNSDDLPSIFKREIEQSVTVVAKNIRLRVYAQNGARALGAIGPANREEEFMVETWIPFLYGGDDKYRLIEMEIPPAYSGESIQVGHIEIEYLDPFEQRIEKYKQPLFVNVSTDRRLVERRMNKDVVKDAYIRRSAENKERAMEYSRAGNYQSASDILMKLSRELENAAIMCDNDRDLFKESQNTRDMSGRVLRNRGYSNDLMKSEILNTSQEFWGN